MRTDIAPEKSLANAPKNTGKHTAGARWFKVDESFVTSGKLAQLSGGAIKVYLVLLKYADRSGKAWPGMGTIGRLAGIQPRFGYMAVAELESAGVIVRGKGRGRSNLYHLQTPSTANTDAPIRTPANAQVIAQCNAQLTAQVKRNDVQATSAMSCAPSSLMDQESMNKILALAKGNEPDQPIPQQTSRSMPAYPMSSYRPEPAHIKQARELRRVDAIERASAERQIIERDAQQLADLMTSIPPEELASLKQRALEKLPPIIRDKLIDKHPADSPMLASLIAAERQVQCLSFTPTGQ